jgi:UbiD family decarboxylase
VNDDIDLDNANALLWAMAYRMNPVEDVRTVPHRGQGHGPRRESEDDEDSTLLLDATMKRRKGLKPETKFRPDETDA